MTTITRPRSRQVRRPALLVLVRRSAAAITALGHSLRTGLSDVATAGQLGPGPEVEIGRWTGARV